MQISIQLLTLGKNRSRRDKKKLGVSYAYKQKVVQAAQLLGHLSP